MHSNRLICKQQYGFHVAIKVYCVYFLARLVKMPKTSAKSTRTKAKPPIARRPRTDRGPVYFKRYALLGRIKNRICLVRRTAFILALDYSLGRTKSMLSRCIFHDLDSSLAKSTRYRLVQFLKQLFARCDSSTAYCFPRWGR